MTRATDLPPLEFTLATVDEAAAVLNETPPAPPLARRPKATFVRRPLLKGDLTLLPETKRWVALLPREQRPLQLASQFPRVANVLALCWTYAPGECKRHLASLIVDERGGRKGFPSDVVPEILALWELHERLFPEVDRDVWEPAIRQRRA